MFRILLIVIFFSFSLVNVSNANFDVKARTAILQDYHSGEILYEKEARYFNLSSFYDKNYDSNYCF